MMFLAVDPLSVPIRARDAEIFPLHFLRKYAILLLVTLSEQSTSETYPEVS